MGKLICLGTSCLFRATCNGWSDTLADRDFPCEAFLSSFGFPSVSRSLAPRFGVCGVAGRDFAEAGSGGVGWSVCRAGVLHFRKEHPQPARPPWTGRLGGWPSPSRRGCPDRISHSRQRWPRSCPDTLVVVPACRRDRCRPRRRRRRRSPPHCLRHPSG